MSKKKIVGMTVAISLVCIVAIVAIIGVLNNDEIMSGSGSSTPSSSNVNVYEQSKELITFNGVKAEFVKLYDPNAGITTMAVNVKLENNSNKTITVNLSDGYVNDTKVQFMTGIPVKIAPGKNAVGAYMFGYDGLGFSKVEDIEKMEFKITLLDESYNAETSETVTINFK